MDPGDSDKGLSKALSTFQQAGAASGIATIGLGLLAAYQKRFSSIHLLRAKLIQQGYENVQKEITKKARASLDIIAGQMETLSGDMDRRVADLVRDVGLGVVAYLPVTASEYKAKFGPNLVDTAKQVLDDNKNLVLLNHGKPAPFSATSDPILRPLKSALSTYETTPTADNAKMLRAALGDLVRDDFDRIHHANVLGDTKSAFAKEYGQPRVIDPVSMASFLRIALEDAPTAKGSALNANLEAADLMLRDTMLSQQQMANIDATTDVSEKEFTRRVSNLKVDSSLLKPLKLDASDSTSAMETAEKIAGWVEKGVEPASDVIEDIKSILEAGKWSDKAANVLGTVKAGFSAAKLGLQLAQNIYASMGMWQAYKAGAAMTLDSTIKMAVASDRVHTEVFRAKVYNCQLLNDLRDALAAFLSLKIPRVLAEADGVVANVDLVGLLGMGNFGLNASRGVYNRAAMTTYSRLCATLSPLYQRVAALFVEGRGDCALLVEEGVTGAPDVNATAVAEYLADQKWVADHAHITSFYKQAAGQPPLASWASTPRVETCDMFPESRNDIYDVILVTSDKTGVAYRHLGYDLLEHEPTTNWAPLNGVAQPQTGGLKAPHVSGAVVGKVPSKSTDSVETKHFRKLAILRCSALHAQLKSNAAGTAYGDYLRKLKEPVSDLIVTAMPLDEKAGDINEALKSTQATLHSMGYQLLQKRHAAREYGKGQKLKKFVQGKSTDVVKIDEELQEAIEQLEPQLYIKNAKWAGVEGVKRFYSEVLEENMIEDDTKFRFYLHIARGGYTALQEISIVPFQLTGKADLKVTTAEADLPRDSSKMVEVTQDKAKEMSEAFTKSGGTTVSLPAQPFDCSAQIVRPPKCSVECTVGAKIFDQEMPKYWYTIRKLKNPKGVAVHTMKTTCPVDGHAVWERVPVSPYAACETVNCAFWRPYIWVQRRYTLRSWPLTNVRDAINAKTVPGCPNECNKFIRDWIIPPTFGSAEPSDKAGVVGFSFTKDPDPANDPAKQIRAVMVG